MDTHELREAFLRFFEERGHSRMPGAPIVPPGDPTLLFTSAGMVQFKPYFMGQSTPPSPRLTTVQKCFRTTDIESVGDTKHLTFFEMLGNFSVGDYFKAEMIPWAWEFVTDVLKLPPERLWASVYLDDDEAYDVVAIGGSAGRAHKALRRGGELLVLRRDRAVRAGLRDLLRLWRAVRLRAGVRAVARVRAVPRDLEPCVHVVLLRRREADAAAVEEHRHGLGSRAGRDGAAVRERGVGQEPAGVAVRYRSVRARPSNVLRSYRGRSTGQYEETDRAIRIVAEHARAVTFLVGDERTPVLPSNEERGYVVRRMLRRAVYFGRRHLGIEEPFMAALADTVIDAMAPAYAELERQRTFVEEILGPEERRFDETLIRGLEMLEGVIEKARASGSVSGADAFLLHDTYGFPVELTREIAAEHRLTVEDAAFDTEMERQRQRARAAAGGGDAVAAEARYTSLGVEASRFLGYETLEAAVKIVAMVPARPARGSGRAGRGDGAQANDSEALEPRDAADEGQDVELVMDQTPFYPEGGGQVGDRGEIVGPSGRVVVEDTQRVAERLIVHRGRVVEGQIAVGDEVTARVDAQHRADTMRNHTATHLLHAALRKVLGAHVKQAGSLVAPDHLRFDFTHNEAVTREQLAEVELLVNEKVRQNVPVHTRLTSFDEAMSEGVLAFFGEKYGEEVRVVEVNTVVPRFSAELCGGTHCERTGDVGLVIITSESSIGAGMRRIEALSGRGAEEYARERLGEIEEALRRLGGARGALLPRVDAVVAERDALAKRVERMERSLASATATDQIAAGAIDVDGVKVLASQVDMPSIDALRYRADALRKTMPSGVAVLGSVIDGRPQFVAMVSPDVIPKGPKAGEILKRVAAVAGGGGGGRPEMAQGGGKDASKIEEALAIVPEAVREMLSGDGSSGKG